jgi:hypothetical protein
LRRRLGGRWGSGGREGRKRGKREVICISIELREPGKLL